MTLAPGEGDRAGVGDGLGTVVCRNVAGRLPWSSLVQSPPLCPLLSPPGARLPNPLSSPPCSPATPSRSSLSIPRFPVGPLEWGPLGLAGLRILRSGVGGSDLLPPRSRAPSSHVLGRSARPPGRAITVAAAAESPPRAVSIPGTGQGAERTPGETEGRRCGTGTELVPPTLQPACTVSHALDS